MRKFLPWPFLLSAVLFAALTQPAFGQFADNEGADNAKPELIDEFGRVGDCDFGARIDVFLVSLQDNPTARGFIVLYNGYDALPSQYDRPPYEQRILNHILFRRYDRSRITLVYSGFREKMTTELWLVRPGAKDPQPTNVLPEPVLPANSAYKYDSKYLSLDYEGVPDEYVLPEVLERQLKEREAEREEEQSGSAESAEVEDNSDVEEIQDPETAAENERYAAEALERFKTHWVSVLFAKHLFKHPADAGVLIFYADDAYYDVPKLRELIDEQLAILQQEEQIEVGRLKVIFGGFRETPVVEYWVVPSGATEPVPTPGERPKGCDVECEEQ